LAALRLRLKETRTGAYAGKIGLLAEELGQSPDAVVASLVTAGLKVPEKAREKPMLVEHAGEVLWFSKNAKGELWLNAKAAKLADKDADPAGPEAEAGNDGTETDAGEGNGNGSDDDGEKKAGRRGGRPRAKKPE